MSVDALPTRPVFYVSDGTGITAETVGHSLLTQFSGFNFITDRLSFVDDPAKTEAACVRIGLAAERYNVRPIVISSWSACAAWPHACTTVPACASTARSSPWPAPMAA